MLAIQQYDIAICHIKGANNVLADILNRYPSELSVAEIRELSRPGTIIVHTIDLKVDNRVGKDLKNLGKLQNTDPRLKGLKDRVTEDTSPLGAKFRLKDDVLFCRRDSTDTWKAMLPSCLEKKVIEYAHTSSGHLGGGQMRESDLTFSTHEKPW